MSNNLTIPKQKNIFYSWFSGLIDGEGCFCIGLRKKVRNKLTFQFTMTFTLGMSQKELSMLKLIKNTLKMGFIKENYDKRKQYISLTYAIYSKKDLANLIKILNKYPLHSSKRKDFKLFKKAYKILCKRKRKRNKQGIFEQSLSQKDIKTIMKIRRQMNLTYNKKKTPGVRKRFHEYI